MKYFKKVCAIAMAFTMATATICVPVQAATLYTSNALYRGKSGMDTTQIKYLQYNLRGMDCYYGDIDGSFGPATAEAVKKYQRKYGLDVDGSAGPQTLNSIVSEVKTVQNKLRELGYYNDEADGVFGPGTTEAVKSFQRDYGLSADGYVGPNTIEKLNSASSSQGAVQGANNAVSAAKAITDGTYKIESALDNNAVIDIAGGRNGNMENVQLWKWDDVDQQRFRVKYEGNGYYSIVAVHSNKSLDGEDRGAYSNVYQYEQNNTDMQRWVLEPAGGNYYYIKNKRTGLYLDACDGKSDNGTNVWFYEGNGTDAQKWKFVEVSGSSGKNNSSSNIDSKIQEFVRIAEREAGVKADSNRNVKYNQWFGMPGQPWCVMFVVWTANQAGIPLEKGSSAQYDVSIKYTASSSACYNWCVANGRFSTTPEVGSLIFIKNQGSDRNTYPAEHTGIVVGISGNKLITVEGNTGYDSYRYGKVQRKETRKISDSNILGYGRLY